MSAPLSLLTLNCEGHKHLASWIPYIAEHRIEVLCLQEVFRIDLNTIERKLNQRSVFLPMSTYHEQNQYGIDPLGDWGLAIFTALPFKNVQSRYYKGEGQPIEEFKDGEPNSAHRGIISVTVNKDGKEYNIINTHFTWTPDGQANDEQRRDLTNFFRVLDTFPEFVVCGDFNAPRGREIHQQISQRYIDHVPPTITTTLDPELFRIPDSKLVVDGIFSTPQYEAENVQVVTGLSDHCGLRCFLKRKGDI